MLLKTPESFAKDALRITQENKAMNNLEIDIQTIQENINGLDKKIAQLQEKQREISESIRSHKKESERLEAMLAQKRLKLQEAAK